MEKTMYLATLLKEYKSKRGLTSKQLADMAGVSAATIDQICAGNRSASAEILAAIACRPILGNTMGGMGVGAVPPGLYSGVSVPPGMRPHDYFVRFMCAKVMDEIASLSPKTRLVQRKYPERVCDFCKDPNAVEVGVIDTTLEDTATDAFALWGGYNQCHGNPYMDSQGVQIVKAQAEKLGWRIDRITERLGQNGAQYYSMDFIRVDNDGNLVDPNTVYTVQDSFLDLSSEALLKDSLDRLSGNHDNSESHEESDDLGGFSNALKSDDLGGFYNALVSGVGVFPKGMLEYDCKSNNTFVSATRIPFSLLSSMGGDALASFLRMSVFYPERYVRDICALVLGINYYQGVPYEEREEIYKRKYMDSILGFGYVTYTACEMKTLFGVVPLGHTKDTRFDALCKLNARELCSKLQALGCPDWQVDDIIDMVTLCGEYAGHSHNTAKELFTRVYEYQSAVQGMWNRARMGQITLGSESGTTFDELHGLSDDDMCERLFKAGCRPAQINTAFSVVRGVGRFAELAKNRLFKSHYLSCMDEPSDIEETLLRETFEAMFVYEPLTTEEVKAYIEKYARN